MTPSKFKVPKDMTYCFALNTSLLVTLIYGFPLNCCALSFCHFILNKVIYFSPVTKFKDEICQSLCLTYHEECREYLS